MVGTQSRAWPRDDEIMKAEKGVFDESKQDAGFKRHRSGGHADWMGRLQFDDFEPTGH